MKKSISIVLLVAVVAATACNQTSTSTKKEEASADTTGVSADIEKRANDLTAAMLSGSRDSLNELTADNLDYGHSNGDVQTKSSFVDSLATKNWGFTQINIHDQHVVNIDGNTAIVRHKLYGEAKNKGKEPAKLALGVLQVWKKTDGKWLLYARQGYKLLPPNDVPPAK